MLGSSKPGMLSDRDVVLADRCLTPQGQLSILRNPLYPTQPPASRHGVPGLDGIILTHDHADAMLGLDDVRSIQVRWLPAVFLAFADLVTSESKSLLSSS